MGSALDPLTNLPFGKTQTAEERRAQVRGSLDHLNKQRFGHSLVGQDVHGAFGDYDPHINITSDTNFNEQRAQEQTYLQTFGRSVAQTVGGIAAGGTLSGIGFLFDLPRYVGIGVENLRRSVLNTMEDDPEQRRELIDYSFRRNPISQMGHAMEDFFMENFQIYQTERAQTDSWRRFLDHTHRHSLAPSIASTISLMIPTGMAAGLIRWAGRAGRLSRGANQTVTTLGAALVSRHNYNMMEGFDVMDRTVQHLMDEGYSYTEAHRLAAQTASNYYNVGYMNIWKDTLAWGALLRGFNFASRNATTTLAQNIANDSRPALQRIRQILVDKPVLSVKEAVRRGQYTWRDWLFQGGLEGVEEFNIQFQKNLMMRNTDIMLGLQDGEQKGFWASYTSGDLLRELRNPETQDAALMGFIGGLTFQGAGMLRQKRDQRRNNEQVLAHQKRAEQEFDYIQKQFAQIEELAKAGDSYSAQAITDNAILSMTLTGAMNADGSVAPSFIEGRSGHTLEWFTAIEQLSDAEIVELGLATEESGVPAVRENAKYIIERITELENIYNKYADQHYGTEISDIVNLFLTEQEFINTQGVKRLNAIRNERQEILSAEPIQVDLRANPELQSAVDIRTRIDALKQLQSERGQLMQDVTGVNMFRFRIQDKSNKDILARIDTELKELNNQWKELDKSVRGDTSRFMEKHFPKDNRFKDINYMEAFQDYYNQEGDLLLSTYKDPATHKQFAETVKLENNKLMQDIFEFQVKASIPDGDYIRASLIDSEGTKVYQLRHQEDGTITAEEFNPESGTLTGTPFTLERSHLITAKDEAKPYMAVKESELVTGEQREALQSEINKALDAGDYQAVLTASRRLYVSGFGQQAADAREALLKRVEDRVNNTRSTTELVALQNQLLDNITSETFLNDIKSLINRRQEVIVTELTNQKTALDNVLSIQKGKIQKLDRMLKKVDQELDTLSAMTDHAIYRDEIRGAYTRIYNKYQREKVDPEIGPETAEQNFSTALNRLINKDVARKTRIQERIEAIDRGVTERIELLKERRANLEKQYNLVMKYENMFNSLVNELTIASEAGEQILPDILIKSEISKAQTDLHSILLEMKSEGYYWNISDIKKHYDITNNNLNLTIAKLVAYNRFLADLGEGNNLMWRARNATMTTILEQLAEQFKKSPDSVPSRIFNTEILERYKKLLNENITKELSKLPANRKTPKVLKAINKTRLFIREGTMEDVMLFGDLSQDAVQTLRQEHPDAVGYSQRLNELVSTEFKWGVYSALLDRMHVAMAKAVHDIKETTKRERQDSNYFKRLPEKMFNLATGPSHVVRNNEWVPIESKSVLQYVNAINDLNPSKENLYMEWVTPEYANISVPEEVRTQYGDAPIIFALIKDEAGKYLTLDGNKTDTFDPEVNLYTSIASTNQETKNALQYVDDEHHLRQLFPSIKSKKGRQDALKALVEQRRLEHEQLVNDALEGVKAKKPIQVDIEGKNTGVAIQEVNRDYDQASPNNVLDIAKGPIDFHIFTSGSMIIDDQVFHRSKGRVVAYEKDHGNLIDIEPRRLNTNEVEDAFNVLNTVLSKLEVRDNGYINIVDDTAPTKTYVDTVKDEYGNTIDVVETQRKAKLAFKDITLPGIPLNPLSYFNKVFSSSLKMKIFKQGNIDPYIRINNVKIPLFAKDKNGKLLNKPAEGRDAIIKNELKRLRYNINNNIKSDDAVPYLKADGTIINYENYTDMILKRSIATTWQRAPQQLHFIEEGAGDSVMEPRFANQNLSFYNKYNKELPTTAPSQGVTPIQTQKPLLPTVVEATKQNVKDIFSTLEVTQEEVSQINDLIQEITTEVLEPAINENKVPKNLESIYKKASNFPKKNVFAELALAEEFAQYIQKNLTKFSPARKSMVLQLGVLKEALQLQKKTGWTIKTETTEAVKETTEEAAEGDTFTSEIEFSKDSDNLHLSVSTNSEVIPLAEMTKIMRSLSTRMGVPMQYMDAAEARRFLARRFSNKEITEGELPHGLYVDHTAYVFGDPHLETPFHEITHPFVDQVYEDNSELFVSLQNEIAENHPEIITHVRNLQKEYPTIGYTFDDGTLTSRGWKEIITTAIGRDATNQYRDGQSIRGKIQQIWESIKEWIRNRLGIDPLQVRDINPNTTVAELGKFVGVSRRRVVLTPQALEAQFKKGEPITSIGEPITTIESRNVIKGQDAYFTSEAMEAMNSAFFTALFGMHSDQIYTLFSETDTNVDLYNSLIEDTKHLLFGGRIGSDGLPVINLKAILQKTAINPNIAANSRQDAQTKLDNLAILEENFPQAIELHKQHLAKYNLAPVTEETIKVDTEKSSTDLWVTESLKYSAKQTTSTNIKMLFASLKDYVLEGNTRSNQNRSELFGNIKLIDFGTMFNLISNRLANLNSPTEIQQMLSAIQDQPGAGELYQRIFKENPNKAEILQLFQFIQTFYKHNNNFDFSFTGNNGVFQSVDAVINTIQKRRIAEWASNLNDLRHTDRFTTRDGMVVYNQKWFRDKFKDAKGKLDINILERFKHIDENSIHTDQSVWPAEVYFTDQQKKVIDKVRHQRDKRAYRNYFRLANSLRLIGIEINTPVIPSDMTTFEKSIGGIFNSIIQESDLDVLGPYSNARNYLQPILDHVSEHSYDTVENQFYNFSNETQYRVNLKNYLTQQTDMLNSLDTTEQVLEELPHLNSIWGRDAAILNLKNRGNTADIAYETLFDRQGNRIDGATFDMHIVEGIKNEETGDGIPFKNMEYIDRLRYNIAAGVKNIGSMFTPGDNSLKRTFPHKTLVKSVRGFQQYMAGTLATEIAYFNEQLSNVLEKGIATNILYTPDVQIIDKYNLKDTSSENIHIHRIKDMAEKSVFADVLKKHGLMSEYQTALQNNEATDVFLTRFEAAIKQELDAAVQKLFDHIESQQLITRIEDSATYKNNGLVTITDSNRPSPKLQADQIRAILQKATMNTGVFNIEQMKIFTGHPAHYGNADNFYKRMSAMVGTKKTMLVDGLTIPLAETAFPRAVGNRLYYKDGVVSTNYDDGAELIVRTSVLADAVVKSDIADSIADIVDNEAYLNMVEGDGIGLISLEGYRDMALFSGVWNLEQEKLYQWLRRPEGATHIKFAWYGEPQTVIRSDLKNLDGSPTTFPMLKPQYFGPLAQEGFTPTMYKTGLVPLLPSLDSTHESAHAVMKYMSDNNVDIVTFESANKVGTQVDSSTGLAPAYTEEGVPNLSNDTITQDTYAKYWGIQLETGHKPKYNVVKGSQFMKHIFSNIYGREVSPELRSLASELMDVHNKLVDIGVQELKDEFGFTEQGYEGKAINKLIDFIKRESVQRNALDNVIDSLDLLQTHIKRFGFDIVSNRDKIENILASIAQDRIFSQHMNGAPLIQASSVFMEVGGRRQYADENMRLKSNTLKFHPKTGTLDVMMSHRFRDIIGDIDISDTRIDSRLLEAVGFRIPTSGLNSIERIRVVKFLPQEYGDTIVLPSEIVAKAGSDFDIDKLNVFIANYIKNEKTGAYESVVYNPKKPTRAGLENKLIELSRQIISQKENRSQHLESIGIKDFEAAEKLVLDLRGETKDSGSFSQAILDMTYQSMVEQRNLSSKVLTGRTALHNTDHVVGQISDYYMSFTHKIPYSKHNKKRITEDNRVKDFVWLGGVFDADGNYITSTLNQTVNAAVDGAKNPLFFTLNINNETINTLMYMIRAGVPLTDALLYLNQPIIREYTELTSIRKSETDTGLETQKQVRDRLERKYGKPTKGQTTRKLLENQLRPGQMDRGVQRNILSEYLQMENSAAELNNYIQKTRLDVMGMGKNTSEMDIRYFEAREIAEGKSDVVNADKAITEGFYAPYYRGLESLQEIYGDLFIHMKREGSKLQTNADAILRSPTDTNRFRQEYMKWIAYLDTQPMLTLDDKVKILDQYKSDYITSVIVNNDITMGNTPYGRLVDMIPTLMSGENSIAAQLHEYQKSGKKNTLTNALQPIIGREVHLVGDQRIVLDTVKLFDQRLDTMDGNSLVDGWRELYATNPGLAKGLAAVTILQSGLQLSPITYTKFIPAPLYMEIIESAFSNKTHVTDAVNFNTFDSRFLANNYNNHNLVRTVKKHNKKLAWYKIFPTIPEYERLLKLSESKNPAVSTEAKEDIYKWHQYNKPTTLSKPKLYLNLNVIAKSDNLLPNVMRHGDDASTGELEFTGIRDYKSNQSLTALGETPLMLTPISVPGSIHSSGQSTEQSIQRKLDCT